MLKQKIAALALSALFILPQSAQAADQYEFDKAHTQIMFSVSHLGFSNSHGRFTDFDGGFTFDAEKVEDSVIDVTINSGSIEMDHKGWNDHLKNADFLYIEKFPEISFQSNEIVKTADDRGEVSGDLTILGITKPVTLEVVFNREGIHPYSKRHVAGFSATGEVKRSDFGMTYGLPGVGDMVSIKIEVEGMKIEEKAEAKTDAKAKAE